MAVVAPTINGPRWAGPGAQQYARQVGGTRVHWIEAGQGKPLVMLHGYGGTAQWWVRNLPELSQDYHVYALDVPGFGRSRMRDRFTMQTAVGVIADWLDALGLSAVDIVAHSMGGQVALLLAARYPKHVRSLLLAAPAGLPFDTGLVGIAMSAWRSRQGGDKRFTPLVIGGAARTGPRILWQAVQEIRSVDVRPHLQHVTAPTLLLWGERDVLLSPANGPVLADAISGADLQVVPGGHNLMFERPEAFNAAVRSFLRGIDMRA